ncbi:MAG: phospholipase D-like domain-containing protein, partial [Pyrinomonadaceae bacterium]
LPVGDFEKGGLSVGFTRAFLKSQAFANHYGASTKLKPSNTSGVNWLFDMAAKAGSKDGTDFSYDDMYIWLGYTARVQVYDLLDEAIGDGTTEIEMFAYDLNDPGIAERCLALAAVGRIRMILDNATLHVTEAGKPTCEEDDFEVRFNTVATAGSELLRARFGRYSHSKVIILKRNGAAKKVITGSTNFAVTGLYVNANHVLLYDRPAVAQYYSDVFNFCWAEEGKAAAFKSSGFATNRKNFTFTGFPRTEIEFSPHNDTYAEDVLDTITAHVQGSSIKSVLFAVMEMGDNSTGTLIRALRDLHKDDSIYTYGVTDNSSGDIALYKPGRKNGLLINAKQATRELPPPFKSEAPLPGHAIHHKFVITNFNKASGRVYCGSSNLALGGEKANGDNLICIKDEDVATAFAIEATRLTDHYNFRSVREPDIGPPNQPPKKLDDTGAWVNKFFDTNDIRCVEREILA